MTVVPANDAHFRLEGRIDARDPAQPVLIWSGSRVCVDFDGPELAVRFGATVDQAVFNLTVDGRTEIVDLHAGPAARFGWPHPLGPGRHELELGKRSEAAKGFAAWTGLELATGAQVHAPRRPPAALKLEFFGDSITAGACNEDGAEDQWNDFRTHNHALSYAALAAQALGADHRAMAISGMGIAIGWEPVRAGRVWDKLYAREDSPPANLTAWQPDVAFVNLGENDASYSEAHGLPFPAGYRPGYVALVRALRAAYPRAEIVLLRGGMEGGARNPVLAQAWQAAVDELEAGDPRITHFVFQHWSHLHPRVADHRAMAAELVAWLRAQPFLAATPPPAN